MKKIIGVLVVCAGVLGLLALELFYFQFHKVFQDDVVVEAMIQPVADSSVGTVVETETVLQGQFGEIDAVHKGSGMAKLIRQDGSAYVRFEDFKVTNGPDLYVYLSDAETPGQTLESLGNYVSLGKLKGNIGDQNYAIPADFTGAKTVVIWCQRFGVLFTFARFE